MAFHLTDQLGSACGQPLVCRLPQVVREEGRAGGAGPLPGWGTCKGEQVYGFVFYIVFVWLCQILVLAHRVFSLSLRHGAGSPTQAPCTVSTESGHRTTRGSPAGFTVILGGLGPGGRTGDKGKVRSREQGFSASAPASSIGPLLLMSLAA